MKIEKPAFIRNFIAVDLIEYFLAATVSSILLVRFFLYIAGYPQIGSDDYHIAHVLWGGFFMLIGFFIGFAFLGRVIQILSAVIGGIGFGLFIDELGKFVTRDYNYFFQPTIAIIYTVVILLYLFGRSIQSRRAYTKKEYLINALEMLKEAVEDDLDGEEIKIAKSYLRKSDSSDPLVTALKHALDHEVAQNPPRNLFVSFKRYLKESYYYLIEKRWFFRLVLLIFSLHALAQLFSGMYLFLLLIAQGAPQQDQLTISSVGQVFFSFISALLVIIGLVYLRRKRLTAFILFRYSILITLFFTQVFAFYHMQFFALTGLIGSLFLLIVIEYAIEQEKRRTQTLSASK